MPVDLAYTPVALSAHTDQPYRAPTPGIQFLHTIVNGAPGGASTVVDGLAAVDSLRDADPEAHALLCSLPVEFRYDIGTDVKVFRAPLVERHPDGSLGRIRFSPRLDYAPLVDPDTLDVFYRGRRWLAEALNDPARQIEYRMEAGEVLVVDNHRVLHGRTSFDPTRGDRHLQGCYIEHDGPVTEWILNDRARKQGIA
jgi:gamma-butyrobetaine dioxygenase